MGKQCFLCDGPIVNGRCKWCGMPYRKDDELYHLNEDRREHMTHASEEAKKILRDRSTPLGDRAPGNAKNSAGAGKRKAEGRAKAVVPNQPRTGTGPGRQEKPKKKSGGLIWLILIIFVLVMENLEPLLNWLRDILP